MRAQRVQQKKCKSKNPSACNAVNAAVTQYLQLFNKSTIKFELKPFFFQFTTHFYLYRTFIGFSRFFYTPGKVIMRNIYAAQKFKMWTHTHYRATYELLPKEPAVYLHRCR